MLKKLTEKNINSLKSSKLFSGINDSVENILSCLDPITKVYKKDEYIYIRGEELSYVGFVLSGNINIYKEDINGNQNIIASIDEGDLFAEVYIMAGVKEIPVSVMATCESKVIFMDFNKIMSVCENNCIHHNQLIKNLMIIISRKNLYLNSKIEIISKKTIREKVMTFLHGEIKKTGLNPFKLPFNRQEMADYLAVDRSALSRELSKMKKDGLIDYKKGRFSIINKNIIY